MGACANCGFEYPEGARFCPGCAASLATAGAAHARRQSRRVVTALFSDVADSTALAERLDPEVLRDVINHYFAAVRAIIERHGGTVEKFVGDAVMAVFGAPHVHEDDALRAVRAAAEIRATLPALGAEVGEALEFRTGVNTGRVLVGEGENIAIGDAVNVAARLQQAARPGEIIIGEPTFELVRDAVEVESLQALTLKGKSAPVRAFRVLRVEPHAPGIARRLDAPLVGRALELRLLRATWERSVDVGECHLFTILGSAGVGKSRLVAELAAELAGRATLLSGRCLPYGDAITFWPLAEALAPMRAQATTLLGLLESGTVAAPGELFLEVRRLFESLAAERPVLLHVDDVQWGEPMLLDLLDNLAGLTRGVPLMLLCTARPELLEQRAAWGAGRLNATACLLEPLRESEAGALLDQHRSLDDHTRGRILEVAQGNPLFLQEMAALVSGGARVGVPLTIQALLAARLEILDHAERQLLECAAIEGEVFHRAGLDALLGSEHAAAVPRRIDALVRKEFIRPIANGGEAGAFRFSHLLLRDAAYEATPLAVRAQLHERRGRWLAEHAEDHTSREEVAGWHLERAARYLRELGREPEPALELEAAERLRAAGRRASDRWDIVAARTLLERALALSAADAATNALIAIELADQLIRSGDFGRAGELLATAHNVPELAGRARLAQLELAYYTRPHSESVRLVAEAVPELMEEYAARGDHLALARTRMLLFWGHWHALRAGAAAAQARLAAEHAALARSEHLRQWALTWYLVALADGPSPVADLAAAVDDAEREQSAGLAPLGLVRAEIARREGRFGDARAELERSAANFEALGQRIVVASCRYVLSRVEALSGDLDAAIAAARESDAMLEALGERGLRSTVQADLASMLAERGDPAGARAAIDAAETLGDPADEINTIVLQSVRARLAVRDGDLELAEASSRSALEHAAASDFPLAHTYAGNARISVERALEHSAAAVAHARALLALHERIGDEPQARATRALIAEIEASP